MGEDKEGPEAAGRGQNEGEEEEEEGKEVVEEVNSIVVVALVVVFLGPQRRNIAINVAKKKERACASTRVN